MTHNRRILKAVPIVVAAVLIVSACGSSGGGPSLAEQAAAPAPAQAASTDPAAPAAVPSNSIPATAAQPKEAPQAAGGQSAVVPKKPKAAKPTDAAGHTAATGGTAPSEQKVDSQPGGATNVGGATDTGVTKNSILFGGINMHGMALGNVLIAPIVAAVRAEMSAINDRGGILGRRLNYIDCDDGPGEVSRAKSCIKKLVVQDKVFALMGGATWASASIHDDLAQYKLPLFGAWAYSQTEWQDPYMFPTHMSMLHEALAGANWVKDTVKPKTYGLICLTSPEMQLACQNVRKVLDPVSKMVKQVNVSIGETSMSAQVLGMRAANPDHIVHYVVNPATIAKFVLEATQQQYWPPMGMSGNHLLVEMLGSLFGKWPVGRYWVNTTYKIWGSQYMATMNKYARGNDGINNHISQASYTGVVITAEAMKAVGWNLTRAALMAAMSNGRVWSSDADLDQKFSYTRSERNNEITNQNYVQGREFMYKYTDTNNRANPDGSPNGWELTDTLHTK